MEAIALLTEPAIASRTAHAPGRNVLQKLNWDCTSVLCKVLQPVARCRDPRLRWGENV